MPLRFFDMEKMIYSCRAGACSRSALAASIITLYNL